VKGSTSINPDDFYFVSILSVEDSIVMDYQYFDTPDFLLKNIKKEEFILQISSPLLYKTYSACIRNTGNQPIVDAGYIQLEPVVQSIDEITVTAMLPKVKFTEGKLIYDIQNNLDFKTLNSLDDILKRIPFVIVEDGKISVFGKKNTLVLVNGLLPKNDNWEMISPEEIKDVEVITNPSAEYNAGGMAVINIITKRTFSEGFQGQLSSGISRGEYWRSNNSLQLGYATGNVNLYTNITYNPYKRLFSETYERYFPDGSEMYNQLDQVRTVNNNHSIVLGLDYLFHPKHMIGFQYQHLYNNPNRNTINTNDLIVNSQLRPFRTLTDVETSIGRNIYDINYTYNIDSIGKKLTVNVGYVDYQNQEDTDIEETSDGLTAYKESYSKAKINLFTANMDYLHKTANDFTGKVGLYYSHNENNSYYDLLNRIDANKNIDPNFSNGAKINENKLAAYLTGRKNWAKFYISGGLRFEHVNYSNKDREENVRDVTYNNWFPSIEVGYDINEKIQTNLSLTRKVHYPTFKDLDPSTIYVDTLTYYMGNTNLKPEYSYNLGLNIIYNRFVNFSLGYSKIDDPINSFFVKRLNPTSMICIAMTENLSSQETWTASLSVPYQYRSWTMQNSIGFNYNKVKFESEGIPMGRKKGMVYLYSYQGFKLPQGFNLSFIYQYNSSGLDGLFYHEDRHIFNCALNKSLLNDKLILSLRYDDIFKGNKQRVEVELHDIRFIQAMKNDASFVSFSLKYTFGKSTRKYEMKQNSKEELKRIQ